MSTKKKKFVGSTAWPVSGASNLTTICEPVVEAMWDLLHLTTLQACTAVTGITKLNAYIQVFLFSATAGWPGFSPGRLTSRGERARQPLARRLGESQGRSVNYNTDSTMFDFNICIEHKER
jgi:hypothetical protein